MKFSEKLIRWYLQNKRDLPWRNTKDPYAIWVSEIILQQTRVEQGLDYYNQFIKRFPNLEILANSSEDDVLKCWQGLGYYSRARNMRHAAMTIMTQNNGQFPDNFKSLLELKGIGEYTAAAIASIAFDEPVALADGNVIRVLSRIYNYRKAIDTNEGKKAILKMAEKEIDTKIPGTFNQALMEFGALVCKPLIPNCKTCIFNEDCKAFEKGIVEKLPVKKSKTLQSKRCFHYLVVTVRDSNQTFTVLNKREKDDIWKGLYDFPHFETTVPQSKTESMNYIQNKINQNIVIKKVSKEYKHVLSHQRISAWFYLISCNENIILSVAGQIPGSKIVKINVSEIKNYPVPRLIDKFLEENDFF